MTAVAVNHVQSLPLALAKLRVRENPRKLHQVEQGAFRNFIRIKTIITCLLTNRLYTVYLPRSRTLFFAL